MADQKHLEILKEGVKVWNEWRKENPDIRPDLTKAELNKAHLIGAYLREADLIEANLTGAHLNGANLIGARLNGANLREAHLIGARLRGARLIRTSLNGAQLREGDLRGAHLMEANLMGANLIEASLREADLIEANLMGAQLRGANLREADLRGANLREADLVGANLREVQLRRANLMGANLKEADLRGANLFKANLRNAILNNSNLTGASLIETSLENTNITGCNIYGISVWNIKLNKTKQKDLIITHEKEPSITVDSLEVAQFIYLLLHNEKIRHVIDTITSKVVLILGRFTHERKAILDAIREELRRRDYTPILFDFKGPSSRDITETISILAHMARFVIADITDARSIPQELQAIVPNLPSVPVQPLLQSSEDEYGMFEHFKSYPWVLTIHCYRNLDDLMATLKEKVIEPVEVKVLELGNKK